MRDHADPGPRPRSGTSARDVRPYAEALASVPTHQGRFERALRLLIRAWCRLVGWRISVTFAGPLPRHGDAPGAGCLLVAAPHRAWLEPFLLLAAWPPDAARLAWLADGRTATRSWWRRRLLPRLGVIPISAAAGGPRAYAGLVASACERGLAVVVFPEVGPPSPPERTRRISPGFAYLALPTGAPIVPLVIGGTHRIVRGSAFSVDVCAPIDPGPAMTDPFVRAGRVRAHALAGRFEQIAAALLPARTREADERSPDRARWTWLGRLLG